ncbi:hypothetical protein SAMN05421870_106249 [Streptomyces qinglanensis]|uniref:Uncharacterized protein n=1 Tax=Streptomyces qinglanensis TaxID=943816 RepID=A0A1H9TLY7_9ACTN|nr:hypothetical protein SAMN05421870_106249 [Streptomyces qinglanensis]
MSLPESADVPHGEQTRRGGAGRERESHRRAAHAGAARPGEGSTA